jgi:hypothetical protein
MALRFPSHRRLTKGRFQSQKNTLPVESRPPTFRAVQEILCPVKVTLRVAAPRGREDLAGSNADTPFPKPL